LHYLQHLKIYVNVIRYKLRHTTNAICWISTKKLATWTRFFSINISWQKNCNSLQWSRAAFLNQNHSATRFHRNWVASEKHSCFMVHFHHIILPSSFHKRTFKCSNVKSFLFVGWFWLDKILFYSLIGIVICNFISFKFFWDPLEIFHDTSVDKRWSRGFNL
jgi:hypothetical protein